MAMNLKKLMLSSQYVEHLIIQSLQRHKPLALIRINDGENRALGYKLFVTKKQLPHWYRYTGIEQPNEKVRSALIHSIKEADIVGFPTQDNPLFRPLSEKILSHYKLRPKKICNGIINRFLLKTGGLERIIRGRKVILVGLTIGEALTTFKKMGGDIVGIEKVKGFDDIPRVIKKIASFPEFDVALVSAGIPAKILCCQISKRFGKVALDMGHIPELILNPNKRYGQIMKEWLVKHPPMTTTKAAKDRLARPHRPTRQRKTQSPREHHSSVALSEGIQIELKIRKHPSVLPPQRLMGLRLKPQQAKNIVLNLTSNWMPQVDKGEVVVDEIYQPNHTRHRR